MALDIFGNTTQNTHKPHSHKEPENFELNLSTIGHSVEDETPEKHSFKGIWFITAGIFLALSIQCSYLQITQNQANAKLSEGNSIRYIATRAERGLITDINSKTLAQNSRKEALAIDPQTLPVKKSERQKVYSLLEKKANVQPETIKYIEDHRLATSEAFAIRSDLTTEESLLYKEYFADTLGVKVIEIPTRTYATMTSLGQFMGYTGVVNEDDIAQGFKPDQIVGKSGIERWYEGNLSSQSGRIKAEVNAYGEIVRYLPNSTSEQAKAGDTLKLNIDSNLQEIVATALKNELARRTKRLGDLPQYGAAAVVVDPNTGAIKAMVSLPDYDNNAFAKGISAVDYETLTDNTANPLLNRCIQGTYPPGSTIKPLIAGAALQEGIITADTQMDTPAAIKIGDFSFPDWKTHGLTNTRKAIAESNDIFFYAVGGGWAEKNFKGLGMEKMNTYLAKYGLGNRMGIDIAGESKGVLPDDLYKQKTFNERWYIGDTYHSSIGQGYTLTTPLQMAIGTATIANGGTTYKPHIAYSLTDSATNKETMIAPEILNQGFVSPANMKIVQEGMRMTVESGSARPLNTLKVTSAGKTGTAQFGDKGLMHAWYTGYAPYENPTIAFSILIEAGGDSFYSSLPVAEEILRNYFGDPLAPGQKLNSEPNLANTEFKGEH